MSKGLAASLVFSLAACAPLLAAQDDSSIQPFSPEQLDNLLAPIALYPDPLLAQVLLAATFPDQIDEAARFCRGGADIDDIDIQPWDVSVKAVAHYPTVLYIMADSLDWTTALGQAYINQSADLMASVQRLRQEAYEVGNLVTTPEQDVEVDDGDIEIWPAQPQYCYLPVYDPSVAFFGSGGIFGGSIVTFPARFPIGVWLNYDFDWHRRRIYYHGWEDGPGWIARSRPYIHVNSVYVNDNLRNLTVNRSVTTLAVNYGDLTRYNSVHQDVEYGNTRINAGVSGAAPPNNVNNKIIQLNSSVDDGRIALNRGRAPDQPVAGQPESNRGGNRGSFDAKLSSQRGPGSRAQATHSASVPRSSGGGGSHGGSGGSRGGGRGRH
jgi:uncharacterized membrane protein YgcG